MKSKLLLSFFVVVMALAVVALPLRNVLRSPRVHPASIEEERIAADAVLAEKLSGPQYFHAPAGVLQEHDGPWIGQIEAIAQMPHVVAERNLGPEGARAVELLINTLAEPHPSRAVGGMRIHLLRLNLSLDSIK
jgi:hypothetical protein